MGKICHLHRSIHLFQFFCPILLSNENQANAYLNWFLIVETATNRDFMGKSSLAQDLMERYP